MSAKNAGIKGGCKASPFLHVPSRWWVVMGYGAWHKMLHVELALRLGRPDNYHTPAIATGPAGDDGYPHRAKYAAADGRCVEGH